MSVIINPAQSATQVVVNPPDGGNAITIQLGTVGQQGEQGLPGPNFYIPDYDTCTISSRDANGNPQTIVLYKNSLLVGVLDITYNISNKPTQVRLGDEFDSDVAIWNISYDGSGKFLSAVRTLA